MPTRNHNTSTRWKKRPGSFDALKLQHTWHSENVWGIPFVFPQPSDLIIPDDLIPYAYAQPIRTERPVLIHFHLDDYKFESIWNEEQQSLTSVTRSNIWAACSPGFSIYFNMPLAAAIWNTHRNRWIGRFWQMNNVIIIPTVLWGTSDTYQFCFAGIPHQQIINLRTYKTFTALEWHLFLEGYQAMIDSIEPKQIIWFGVIPDQITDTIPKTQFDVGHWTHERMKRVKSTRGRSVSGAELRSIE